MPADGARGAPQLSFSRDASALGLFFGTAVPLVVMTGSLVACLRLTDGGSERATDCLVGELVCVAPAPATAAASQMKKNDCCVC